MAKNTPMLLCILDGWGKSDNKKYNAIEIANTPNWDRFLDKYPYSMIKASGEAVGLPDGQMGNSEVGHMNMGAGRVVKQSLPLINDAIKDGEVEKNKALLNCIKKVKKSGGDLHLVGLLSDGGVHSHQNHIAGLAKIGEKDGLKVYIHAITDGRDTKPKSAEKYIKKFYEDIGCSNNIKIATLGGRYYTMDRGGYWERTEKAYNAIAFGEGEYKFDKAEEAVLDAYNRGESDEFILPSVRKSYEGMKDGDGLVLINFRADRMRQIANAFADPGFDEFNRKQLIKFSARAMMSEYSEKLKRFYDVLFPPAELKNVFGEIISDAGLLQLRIAESEKYAHVTFFFNGGEEKQFKGEDRIIIKSPQVSTYDLKPEMSAYEVCDKVLESLAQKKHDVIILNFANPDMVGHTGDVDATVRAIEVLDECIGKLEKEILKQNGLMIVTADHGNCEDMYDEKNDKKLTAHTTNPVWFILVGNEVYDIKLRDGILSDITPTMLDLLGIEKPVQMTSNSLIKK